MRESKGWKAEGVGARAQVPWTLTIIMPPNEKFVTVFNARLTNTSADGASMMVVSDEWQTLQPNRANAADVSFLVDASSQARRSANHLT